MTCSNVAACAPNAGRDSLLSRLSAGYIHLTQKYYNDIGADVVVEEDFQNMLIAHLTDLDMSDVDKELEKMKREELN